MTDASKSKNQFTARLNKEGFKIAGIHAGIEGALKKLLGPDRYNDYLDAGDAMRAGTAPISALYQMMENRKELHLLFSHQIGLIIESGAWLGEKALSLDSPPRRVADLGCGTGALTRWLADRLPSSDVVGLDREENMLEAAREDPKKAEFQKWDYGTSETAPTSDFDVLVSALGIDFRVSGEDPFLPLDFASHRDTDYYQALYEQAAPIFANWRSISRDGARLFTVLRLGLLTGFIGVVDAAAEAGWAIQLDSCSKVKVGVERMPGLVFVAAESSPPDENHLISFWEFGDIPPGWDRPLKGDLATALYRSLSPKKILASEENVYDDGHTMESTVSTCGPFALLYAQATTGFAGLKIHPAYEAEGLDPCFEWEG